MRGMFNCVCIDVDCQPEVFETSIIVARKEHRCCECGEVIKPGQRYERVKGLWDEYWSTFKTCIPCATIRSDFMSCGWIYGRLWEELANIYCGDTDWLR